MKINMTIGRFQPFTQGHLNMVNEGENPCIIYQIQSPELPNDLSKLKVDGRLVKPESIKRVYDYIMGEDVDLTETDKSLCKKPFTNELVNKELEIVKKNNSSVYDVVYVVNAADALCKFNKFINDNPRFEPEYWMCGDDRLSDYKELFNRMDKDTIKDSLRGSIDIPNHISNLKLNIGKGRTRGVSGTDVRNAIIKNDKAKFSQIMPKGTGILFNDFRESFLSFANKLKNNIKESLSDHIANMLTESLYSHICRIFEGGQAGHMAHVIDYTELTGYDLIELVEDLFGGKVENMKEKLDGMNIFATMNQAGEVVFIRNNGDLNSERGGMTIDDMKEKWAGKDHQIKVFVKAGEIITDIFTKLGIKYFNPNEDERKVINCECIITGKTNIMPYETDRVAFHGYKIYKKNDNKWVEVDDVEGDVQDIYKTAEGIDAAKPRPQLIINNVKDANKFAAEYVQKIKNLFKGANLSLDTTIEEYKFKKFDEVKPEWLMEEVRVVFNRWFNGDKSFKASELKKIYPEHYSEIMDTKFAKKYITLVTNDLDSLFLSIGNDLIDILSGFTNDKTKGDVINTLKTDLESTVNLVKKSDDEALLNKLTTQLQRLAGLGDKVNAAEGIVFVHKGKRMKLTGSFAPINAILGSRYLL